MDFVYDISGNIARLPGIVVEIRIKTVVFQEVIGYIHLRPTVQTRRKTQTHE